MKVDLYKENLQVDNDGFWSLISAWVDLYEENVQVANVNSPRLTIQKEIKVYRPETYLVTDSKDMSNVLDIEHKKIVKTIVSLMMDWKDMILQKQIPPNWFTQISRMDDVACFPYYEITLDGVCKIIESLLQDDNKDIFKDAYRKAFENAKNTESSFFEEGIRRLKDNLEIPFEIYNRNRMVTYKFNFFI